MSCTTLTSKRSFEFVDSPDTSPYKLNQKRCRYPNNVASCTVASPNNMSPGSPNSSLCKISVRSREPTNYFNLPSSQENPLKRLNSVRPKKFDQDGTPLFTIDQVKDIVGKALQEREQQLRMEYDEVLHHKLEEQFMNFTKFNEDHIHRQLKESTWSYMS
eukprot:Sdes_comp15803_c0_seq1m4876